jgi:subtilisin family serine protease
MARLLAAAAKKGVVLIAAAGNAGPKSPALFPASDPNVIAVTATDADDRLFQGSNRGHHVAVAAPGVNLLLPTPGGSYGMNTGTSFAAALISGIAALVLEREPTLTPDSVRRIMLSTARDLGPAGRDRDFGAGLADAYEALRSIRTDAVATQGGNR